MRERIIEGCEDLSIEDGSHFYLLNSIYTVGSADEVVLEFPDCIRNNDIDPEHYASTLVRQVCSAVDEVWADPAKEAEYISPRLCIALWRYAWNLPDRRRYVMVTAKVFQSGNSQAIRIPREVQTDRREFLIRKVGEGYLLCPVEDPWFPLRLAIGQMPEDFMHDRDQPSWEDVPEREGF